MMRSESKRILIYILVSVILSLNLIGCGESVDLTEEQTELVSEYAAGLLLKYEKGHAIGLSRVADIKFEELDVTPTPTPTPTPEPTPEPEEAASEDDEALVGGISDGGDLIPEQENAYKPEISEVFGMPDMDIEFTYAQLCDSYPESEDLVFSMNATEGKELLIIHFNITNPNAEIANVIANKGDYKLRAVVNDTEKIRAELTFLTNDLTSYVGTFEPGQSADVVLVFEVDEGTQIESLGLLVVNGGDQYAYSLG